MAILFYSNFTYIKGETNEETESKYTKAFFETI